LIKCAKYEKDISQLLSEFKNAEKENDIDFELVETGLKVWICVYMYINLYICMLIYVRLNVYIDF
jgi:hypothetical protein